MSRSRGNNQVYTIHLNEKIRNCEVEESPKRDLILYNKSTRIPYHNLFQTFVVCNQRPYMDIKKGTMNYSSDTMNLLYLNDKS
jgi:hypothetical protein